MKKGGPTLENCPKCKKAHDQVPAKVTLCQKCQDQAALAKEEAIKKKAEAEANKRLPLLIPVKTMNDLSKVRTLVPGDIFVCDKNGWYFFPGDRDSSANILKLLLQYPDVAVLSDWGGVGALFLEDPNKKGSYLPNPRKIKDIGKKSAWIFSYTPVNKVKELEQMRASSFSAGFDGMIITTQKGVDDEGKVIEGEMGKHQLLNALFTGWNKEKPDYYEDTGSVLDNLSADANINKFWVRPKDAPFRDMTPKKEGIVWLEQDAFLEKLLQ